jgi:glutamate dehydrogenase/leucine dehydrogenase
MSAKGGVAVVMFEIVKFFWSAMDVRKRVKLKT